MDEKDLHSAALATFLGMCGVDNRLRYGNDRRDNRSIDVIERDMREMRDEALNEGCDFADRIWHAVREWTY